MTKLKNTKCYIDVNLFIQKPNIKVKKLLFYKSLKNYNNRLKSLKDKINLFMTFLLFITIIPYLKTPVDQNLEKISLKLEKNKKY